MTLSLVHHINYCFSNRKTSRFCVTLFSSKMHSNCRNLLLKMDFPGGSVVKNLPANARDASSIPGSGRSPGGGHGNPRQYSCLENPTDRGAWWSTVHGATRVGHDLVTKQPTLILKIEIYSLEQKS